MYKRERDARAAQGYNIEDRICASLFLPYQTERFSLLVSARGSRRARGFSYFIKALLAAAAATILHPSLWPLAIPSLSLFLPTLFAFKKTADKNFICAREPRARARSSFLFILDVRARAHASKSRGNYSLIPPCVCGPLLVLLPSLVALSAFFINDLANIICRVYGRARVV